jgi:arylsulfatase
MRWVRRRQIKPAQHLVSGHDVCGRVGAGIGGTAPTSAGAAARGARWRKQAKHPRHHGRDIGLMNISAYSLGLMGYRAPDIDRIAKEGMIFTDYYAEQSCTAGRSTFITGQSTLRTGLSKVGIPGATAGLQPRDPTLAQLIKPLGYATGQFGENHLGDRNEFLPTVHGFDEFLGNLYHLNAEEEPEDFNYPRAPKFAELFGPRGVLRCKASRAPPEFRCSSPDRPFNSFDRPAKFRCSAA